MSEFNQRDAIGATAEGKDDFVGRALDGRYFLTRRLGAGGMSSVYEGEHMTLGTRFAIKILESELAAQDKNRRRFLQEARAAASIRSPYIVQIYDHGVTSDGIVYFVMELLVGRDLARVLRDEGPLPWTRAQPMLVQIARGLRIAHEHGIIHRDIKPSNCFLLEEEEDDDERRPRVKLLDFGVAKFKDRVFDHERSLTASHEIVGTVGYIAPERIGGAAANSSTDIYSLGALMYRMVVGRLPYRGKSAFLVFEQQVRTDPPLPRSVNPAISMGVEAIILRALARRPEDRYPSLEALIEDLELIPPFLEAPIVPLHVVSHPPQGEEERNEIRAAAVESADDTPTRSLAEEHDLPEQPGEHDRECASPEPVASREVPPARWRRRASLIAATVLIVGAVAWVRVLRESSEVTASSSVSTASTYTVPAAAIPIPVVALAPPPVARATPRAPDASQAHPAVAPSSDDAKGASPMSRHRRVSRRANRNPTPSRIRDPIAASEPVVSASVDTTDTDVQRKVASLAKQRCSGKGPIHIRGAVSREGRLLSARITGGSSEAHACVGAIAKAQRFPKSGTRMIAFDVPL